MKDVIGAIHVVLTQRERLLGGSNEIPEMGWHQKLLTYIYIHTVTPQKVTCWEVTMPHAR